MKIAVVSSDSKAEEVVRQLLSPWHVNFSSLDEADVVVAYKTLKDTRKATVIIPHETAGFHRWLKENNLTTVDTQGKKLKVPATKTLMLTLAPRTQRVYIKSNYSKIADDEPLATRIDDSTFLPPVDIIEEYGLKLSQTLNPRVSSIYRFLTGLPIPYTFAPNRFRDFFMGARKANCDSFLDHLDLDALRYILIRALQEATGELLQKKTWEGRRYACLITHDVDTREGLQRALALKRVEERYDIPSAWFLSTKRYKLESEVISQLANYGEVGAHGTKHDGKLIRLSKEEIVDRLSEAKQILETTVGQDVVGFRAPLLQHNRRIIQAVEEAGYSYDTSIPTWEPMHPTTMGPYGIGTVYPFDINEIIEIPISVPQDHQMLHIFRISAIETIERWLEMKKTIRDLGGIFNILVHPDYELANQEGLNAYEKLLNIIYGDDQVFTAIPSQIFNNKPR